MIDVLFEQHVIQNTGLAAETIWQAVYEAYNAKGRAEGVPFALVFLVLPIAFQTGLLNLDNGPTRDVFPGKKTPPVTHVTEEVKTILNAAKRVGQSFTEMNAVQLVLLCY